ncbi:MAG: hypothetical protein ABIB71_00550 [Candidatus Woesearchaeota archaeon]
MKKELTHHDCLNGDDVKHYSGSIEGIVTSVEKAEDKESIFTIRTEEGEEKVTLPKKVHGKILLGSKVSYRISEKRKVGFELGGFAFGSGGPDARGKYVASVNTSYWLDVLDGEFAGIEYKASGYECRDIEPKIRK